MNETGDPHTAALFRFAADVEPEPLQLPGENVETYFVVEFYVIDLYGDSARATVENDHEARWLNLLGFCLRPGFGETSGDEPGLHSVATAIGMPASRSAATGGNFVSRKM